MIRFIAFSYRDHFKQHSMHQSLLNTIPVWDSCVLMFWLTNCFQVELSTSWPEVTITWPNICPSIKMWRASGISDQLPVQNSLNLLQRRTSSELGSTTDRYQNYYRGQIWTVQIWYSYKIRKGTRQRPGVNFINVFTSSFYARRSCLTVFFALLGSGHVKAACKMLVKLTPGGNLYNCNFVFKITKQVLTPWWALLESGSSYHIVII